jgi:16S rRNA processing protein RimM
MVSPRPTISRLQGWNSVSDAPKLSAVGDSMHSDAQAAGAEARPAARATPAWVVVARLIRPHGRRGELIAEILTDFPERFHQRSRLFLIPPERIGSRPREVGLENFWFLRSRLVMKIQGIDSINDAEGLRGFTVAIPAAERAPLDAGSVYVSDLIGCRVVDLNRGGADVGAIIDVDRDSSSTELLVVRRGNGEGGEDLQIPFVAEYVVRVDAAHRRLEMRLPEGLLEINAPMTEEEKREVRARE